MTLPIVILSKPARATYIYDRNVIFEIKYIFSVKFYFKHLISIHMEPDKSRFKFFINTRQHK